MKICIDPGHGGLDPGAVRDDVSEADLNLTIGFLVGCQLLKLGYEICITRCSDVFIPLPQRYHFANDEKADLFLSIHCDSFRDQKVTGMSVHIYGKSNKTKIYGTFLTQALTKRFPDHKQRGLRYSNFAVLRNTDMSAALVECEFISNLYMRNWLKEIDNQCEIAIALADGIDTFITSGGYSANG